MPRHPLPILLLTAFLGLAAPAAATQRFTAPAAAGTADCSSAANACTLATAITGAASGDDVLLAGGTYSLTAEVSHFTTFTMRPADPAHRPLVSTTGTGQLFLDNATVHDVDFVAANAGNVAPLRDNYGVVDRVRITATGTGALGLEFFNGTITNTAIVVSGTNARGIGTVPNGSTISSTIRNSTVLVTGAGTAGLDIENSSTTMGSTHVTISNSIVRGATWDLQVNSQGVPVSITADHTSYATTRIFAPAQIIDGGGNQTGAGPAFVDQAGGDLREAASSPTIDAGADDPANGTTDLAGQQRQVLTTDIGAYEFQPPPFVGDAAASVLGTTTASLTAPVTPGGLATSFRVDYGTSTAYGASTAEQDAGAAANATSQTVTLDGLSPGTTYHARVTATNSAGSASSGDVTFQTTALATDPAPVATPPVATPPVTTPPAAVPPAVHHRKPPCSGLKGGRLRLCQAKHRYYHALTVCAKKKHAKARKTCRTAALRSYRKARARR